MQTIKVQRQSKNRGTANLSAPHITTSDLFKTQPIFSRLILPHDKFNIKHMQTNLVDSLPVPAFVNLDNSNRWYYQKFSGIWHAWDYYITQSVHKGEVPVLPTINPFALTVLFIGSRKSKSAMVKSPDIPIEDIFTYSQNTFMTTVGANNANSLPYIESVSSDATDADTADFVITDTTSSVATERFYRLNYRGRLLFNVLVSLGYKVPRRLVVDNSGINIDVDNYPLLPLIAYFNVYRLNYIPQKFRAPYNSLAEFYYSADDLYTYFTFSNQALSFTANSIYQIERMLYACTKFYYSNDYFTGSTVYPMDAPGVQRSTFSDVTNVAYSNYSEVINGNAPDPITGNVPILKGPSNNYPASVTSYILNMLQQVTERTQLQALAPNSMLGRLYALFGIKGKENDQLPLLLETYANTIIIRPEIASADTQTENGGRPLGYKAASAGSYRDNDKPYHFEFNDYGVLFCVNTIAPQIFYFEGINREMLLTDVVDYDVENFNTAGYSAISLQEVYDDLSLIKELNLNPRQVFGFTSFGAWFMSPIARLAGDFAIRSVGRDSNVYHTGRYIFSPNEIITSELMPQRLENGESFALVNDSIADNSTDVNRNGHQYDRIFDYQDSRFDHIQQWNYYEIKAERNLPERGDLSIGDENGAVRELQALSDVKGVRGAS